MKNDLEDLEKQIKITFKDKNLLTKAFIHRSYLNEHPKEQLESNERLEFLGDAVLGMLVSEYLYREFPKSPEGDLTNFRSSLVNAVTLSKIATSLNLGEYLRLSKGEEATGGRKRQYILANTFEALVGAIFLDQGISGARSFIQTHLIPYLGEIIEKGLYKDFKSLLQEIAQEDKGITPTYKVISETGPDHAKIFRTAVFLNKIKLAEGEGTSKQAAEQSAAKIALEKWQKKV